MSLDPKSAADPLRPHVAGKKTILLGGHVVSLRAMALQLRELGARKPFILGVGVGTGALPAPDEAEWYSLDVVGSNPVQVIRRYEALLADLPDAARAAVDHYDPEGEAIALGLIVLAAVPDVAGRPRLGARRPSWIALEDKLAIESFWDRAGVARAPSRLVPVSRRECVRAAAELDRGQGTVWAGDARDGPHGGAVFTRWVASSDDEAVDNALAVFGDSADRVRVMPFLEGVPCSMHGMVFDDGECVFRPVEMVTLRRPGTREFVYAGAGTFWDPAPGDRQAMRDVVGRTARALRSEVDYRGAFTVDGVMTSAGFLPTELNPRVGFGLLLLEASVPGLPLGLIALAAGESPQPVACTSDLEDLVVTAADGARRGSARLMVSGVAPTETQTRTVARDGDALRFAQSGDAVIGKLSLGPSTGAGFLIFEPDPLNVAVGAPLGPLAVSAFALADREWRTGIGALQCAESSR